MSRGWWAVAEGILSLCNSYEALRGGAPVLSCTVAALTAAAMVVNAWLAGWFTKG